MTVYFLVTIDTECDRDPHWLADVPPKFKNITEGVPGRLQPLFEAHGIKPTYLLSPEVIANPECADVFKGLNDVELGTHLHGEFVEPGQNLELREHSQCQAMYDRDTEAAKLKNLTDSFTGTFGYAPVSFRAGRYGLSPNSLTILEDLGYIVDTSVTPFLYWSFGNGVAVDYRHCPRAFYYPFEGDYNLIGGDGIMQIPVTIYSKLKRTEFNTPSGLAFINNLLLRSPGFRPEWFRPSWQSADRLMAVADAVIKEQRDEEIVILNMMFHSSEVMPKTSPYNQTEEEAQTFLERISATAEYIKDKHGALSVTLGECARLINDRTAP